MAEEMLIVSVCDGKYTVVQGADGRTVALRRGEPWRDCVGDNLILSLAYEVEDLREQLQKRKDMKAFQAEIHAWASTTFPEQTWESKMTHLKREILEVEEKPLDGSEYGDCLILLLAMAEMKGIDAVAEAAKKLEINKLRKWGPPDAEGVCKHIKEWPPGQGLPEMLASVSCVLDSDGDGDCEYCANHGGCIKQGGPFKTTLDIPRERP